MKLFKKLILITAIILGLFLGLSISFVRIFSNYNNLDNILDKSNSYSFISNQIKNNLQLKIDSLGVVDQQNLESILSKSISSQNIRKILLPIEQNFISWLNKTEENSFTFELSTNELREYIIFYSNKILDNNQANNLKFEVTESMKSKLGFSDLGVDGSIINILNDFKKLKNIYQFILNTLWLMVLIFIFNILLLFLLNFKNKKVRFFKVALALSIIGLFGISAWLICSMLIRIDTSLFVDSNILIKNIKYSFLKLFTEYLKDYSIVMLILASILFFIGLFSRSKTTD